MNSSKFYLEMLQCLSSFKQPLTNMSPLSIQLNFPDLYDLQDFHLVIPKERCLYHALEEFGPTTTLQWFKIDCNYNDKSPCLTSHHYCWLPSRRDYIHSTHGSYCLKCAILIQVPPVPLL